MRPTLRLLSFCALCCALLPPAGAAHARLERAEPAPRSTLSHTPAVVRLRFNEALEADYSRLTVEDSAGRPMTTSAPSAPTDHSLQLTLPALAPGRYRVRYRVLSSDGHVLENAYEFTLQVPPAP